MSGQYLQSQAQIIKMFLRGMDPDKVAYEIWDQDRKPELEDAKKYVYSVLRTEIRKGRIAGRANRLMQCPGYDSKSELCKGCEHKGKHARQSRCKAPCGRAPGLCQVVPA
jgi:hypothetical protein